MLVFTINKFVHWVALQDDLIFLPSKISSSMGHLGPLVLCTRAMKTLHFMETNTLRTTQVEVRHD